ncbi:MAG: ABC transporter ATP-binding protein [Desulfococcaceae bacterium]
MIKIQDLHVRLSGFALKDIRLHIAKGEFFTLMGPTGAGKTVLLEAIAGLTAVSAGKIFLQDQDVTRLAPEKRGIGIVYQDQAMFPHLTVRKNIAYGLRYHRISPEKAKKRTDELVSLMNLSHLLDRLPGNLSGGEKQRVALARALSVCPSVLLLDEPLSALDPNFREEIRHALRSLHQSTDTTFMMVTHDFSDALSMSDRAAVINKGHIEQIGRIEDIFQKPVSAFVADFVGMKNLFNARFEGTKAVFCGLAVELERNTDRMTGKIAIRPEDIAISRNSFVSDMPNMFRGRVAALHDYGFSYEVHVCVNDAVFKTLISKKSLFQLSIQEGNEVSISFEGTAVHDF